MPHEGSSKSKEGRERMNLIVGKIGLEPEGLKYRQRVVVDVVGAMA